MCDALSARPLSDMSFAPLVPCAPADATNGPVLDNTDKSIAIDSTIANDNFGALILFLLLFLNIIVSFVFKPQPIIIYSRAIIMHRLTQYIVCRNKAY
jgi:hypothetical protein